MDLRILENEEDPKSYMNHMHNTVDLWIFIMNLSKTSLRLTTLIAQIDLDLWVFENHYILHQKLKVTQNAVDLWRSIW